MSTEIETLHRPFERWLRGERIPYVRARSDRQSTIALGHPDFTILLAGRALLIEFKTKEGALSREQKERIAYLKDAGCRVHVIRDLADATTLVLEWRTQIDTVAAPTAPPAKLTRYGQALYREENGQLIKVRNLQPHEIARAA